MKLMVLLFVLGVVAVNAKHELYTGWKSYFVGPENREQLKAVGALMQGFELDFLGKAGIGREGLVLVKPAHQAAFTKKLQDFGVPFRVHSENVAQSLRYDDEQIAARNHELLRNGGARIPYDNYQPLSVYDEYIESIAARYPNRVTLLTPQNSFEGRPIKVLKISTTGFEDTRKPVIFIDATIHAREWIAPPTVTWAIHKLLEDVTEPDLVERYDWILIPMANPDGYYHSYTENRWWRKTRSVNSTISGTCVGVDGNRNYDFAWNTVGVSSDPCTDVFPGPYPFSEVETRVIRDLLFEHLDRIKLYLTMHSFGSMILYPWGHNGNLSEHAESLQLVGDEMIDAINKVKLDHFPDYVVGNSVDVIGYAASGASEDYAHSIGIELAYTYELPGLNITMEGFNLPPQYIEQVAKETWDGIVAGVRKVGNSSHGNTAFAALIVFSIIFNVFLQKVCHLL